MPKGLSCPFAAGALRAVRTQVNGIPSHNLTRQTTCVSHRKPTIDQITPYRMQTELWVIRCSERIVICVRGIARKRYKSGLKSVRVRLRIAFPYRVMACLVLAYHRQAFAVSVSLHEWRRHGMRSRDVRGADTDLIALHHNSSPYN